MRFIIGFIVAIILIVAGLYVFLEFGFMSFRADQSPSGFETKYAMKAVDASTKRNAPPLPNPFPVTDASLLASVKLYKEHCASCHGDPVTQQRVLGKSFYPPAPQFMTDAPDMPANQNFYIIKHGIRFTGMPAWGKLLSDNQIWQLTAFLSQMKKLPPPVDQEWQQGENTAKPENEN
ncbi:MAG: c-type cytochrome [Terriglobia bacterium]